VILLFLGFIVMCDDALGSLKQQAEVVVHGQPWFYLRLVVYRFFWLSEGAYGFSGDSLLEADVA